MTDPVRRQPLACVVGAPWHPCEPGNECTVKAQGECRYH